MERITGLYAITPDNIGDANLLYQMCEEILASGVTILQYRDSLEDEEEKFRRAKQLRHLSNNALFIINNSPILAQKVAADGVHLGQKDGKPKAARQLLGNDAIIGVTCHNDIELAISAANDGANYCAFGAIFPSPTKPTAKHCPLAILGKAKEKTGLATVAIGGITQDNITCVIAAGADSAAVCAGIFNTADRKIAVQKIQSAFQN